MYTVKRAIYTRLGITSNPVQLGAGATDKYPAENNGL